jgi:heme-binding protein
VLSRISLKRLLLAAVGLFLVIQVVPYGRAHSNPPVSRAARWPSRRGEQIAEQSCYDCHSNLTTWRWYSNVAPASWLVQHDVEEGRGVLDFSEWDRGQPPLGEVLDKVEGGEMPPLKYTLLHPGTKLSASERTRLAASLTRLYATDPPPAGGN